jgi:hypothetical protein
LTAVGVTSPVKLNIGCDRIAAIRLYESCSNEMCSAGNTFALSEGEVCLKSRNNKDQKSRNNKDQKIGSANEVSIGKAD